MTNQTNLLTLNATIDATCTDEYRRDFVAVADEICKLAGRTQKSLGKIEANADVLVQSISEMNESIRGQSEAINLVNQGISQAPSLPR
ncbi:methyl-accepting chemotaxis protein [Campylobacter rectus]|uniref:methyl-accepting chemotaxis protein n=1 Tax=Campylobacter rectus TaxID=203 RepID=UPI002FC6B94D